MDRSWLRVLEHVDFLCPNSQQQGSGTQVRQARNLGHEFKEVLIVRVLEEQGRRLIVECSLSASLALYGPGLKSKVSTQDLGGVF